MRDCLFGGGGVAVGVVGDGRRFGTDGRYLGRHGMSDCCLSRHVTMKPYCESSRVGGGGRSWTLMQSISVNPDRISHPWLTLRIEGRGRQAL